ncbi:MAG TPA: hypothetical protein VF880_13330 [Actinomycetes bacterium]
MGFQPAQAPLLRAPQYPQPLGRLIGLPGRRSHGVLGQRQPIPGGLEVPAAQQPALERGGLVGGLLMFLAGLLAGLLGLGSPLSGQAQLPRPVRRTLSPEFGEPVTLGAQLPRGQPPYVRQVGVSVASVLLPSRVSTRASSSSGARASLVGCGRSSSGPSGSGPTVRYMSVRSVLLVSCT